MIALLMLILLLATLSEQFPKQPQQVTTDAFFTYGELSLSPHPISYVRRVYPSSALKARPLLADITLAY